VFVSSTLGELAEERRAVSRAVSALRLIDQAFSAGSGLTQRQAVAIVQDQQRLPWPLCRPRERLPTTD
jgi:hypothetical protein